MALGYLPNIRGHGPPGTRMKNSPDNDLVEDRHHHQDRVPDPRS